MRKEKFRSIIWFADKQMKTWNGKRYTLYHKTLGTAKKYYYGHGKGMPDYFFLRAIEEWIELEDGTGYWKPIKKQTNPLYI